MKVRLQVLGTYLAMTLETTRGAKVLRRWPWPHDPIGRRKHLRHAKEYGSELAGLLMCPFEIEETQ